MTLGGTNPLGDDTSATGVNCADLDGTPTDTAVVPINTL